MCCLKLQPRIYGVLNRYVQYICVNLNFFEWQSRNLFVWVQRSVIEWLVVSVAQMNLPIESALAEFVAEITSIVRCNDTTG